MVLLDPETDAVVIRVVYDGPPEAGKTTSVRALAGSLGRPVFTPDQIEGHTVYFDWLDYTGGLFEGHRIRCQVVSVPGQATLAPRRRALLLTADVVVFVADSRREALGGLPGYLHGLGRILAGVTGPPVGLVLQANKRDLPGVAPVAEMRRVLDEAGLRVGIVESIAVTGAGVREAFVFAVRLALDRAREQLRTGTLLRSSPEVGSGEELLAAIQRAERGALELATSDGLQHTRLSEVRADSPAGQAVAEVVAAEAAPPEVGRVWHPPQEERAPHVPGANVAGGMIWPPVHGRLFLHEADEAPPALFRSADGDWYGLSGTRWRIQSPAHATFAELERGRAALIDWARIHSTSSAVISPERCVVLGEDRAGGWRLWQLVRAEESLLERLLDADDREPPQAAEALAECVNAFREAARLIPRAACRLPLTLEAVSATRRPAPFVGLMPAPAFLRPPEPCPPALVEELLARELGPHLERLGARRDVILSAMEHLPAPLGAPALALLRSLWAMI